MFAKYPFKTLIGLSLLLSLSVLQADDTLFIGAGAGYKKPVEKLCEQFTAQTGIAIDRFYGNMQQILTQTERSGQVNALIGMVLYFHGVV